MTTTLDFALIVRLLKDVHNVPAEVVHGIETETGTITAIHAGSVENGSTYPVRCGPGWFNGADYTDDLYLSRVGVSHTLDIPIPPDATEPDVAQLIANMSKGDS